MKRIAIVALVFAVAGCMTMGDQSLTAADKGSVERYVIDGTTTMADVRAVFGDAKTKEQTKGGGETWRYSAVRNRIITAKVQTLTITFNHKGVVTGHRYEETVPNMAAALR
jgi:hypothetical protein